MMLLFLDCETTGLDPAIHVPWEVAAVRAEHTDDGRLLLLDEYEELVILSDEEEAVADPIGLDIGRFHERYHQGRPHAWPGRVASELNSMCNDRPHLVGAVPSFDDRRVGDLMRRCGIAPRWHYHLIDVETIIVGYLAFRDRSLLHQGDDPTLGWKSDDLSRAVGVDPDQFDRHTAMGDVRWCIAQYAAVFDLTTEETP